jgi:FKBP-type peptidyl-prolyl cis-trans isomerase (trigger factor)
VQVEFNSVNAVTKQITINVPAEKATQAWEKYLRKAAKDVAIPGFRKGKAPLNMVERMYSDTLLDYFYKDSINDFFEEVVTEHNLDYLLFPDVKDIQWERGSEMIIKIEIEHEPELTFKQLDNLSVPYHPATLDSAVDKYLEELRNENGRIVDVEEAAGNDAVEVEISLSGYEEPLNATIFAGTDPPSRSLESLIGTHTGDNLEAELSGMLIKLTSKNAKLDLDNESSYPCHLIVGAISRVVYPELDDEFAKDMEFEDMATMRSRIEDDLRLKNEHQQLDSENFAIIAKLYVDNNFDLPMKTIDYLAKKEAEKSPYQQYRQYLEYQYRMQISNEMVTMYILNNLRQQIEMEVTDEMLNEYITHEAILADFTLEAYKEKNKEELASEAYRDGVKNFFILRKLASTATFFVPEPEPQPAETEVNAIEGEES